MSETFIAIFLLEREQCAPETLNILNWNLLMIINFYIVQIYFIVQDMKPKEYVTSSWSHSMSLRAYFNTQISKFQLGVLFLKCDLPKDTVFVFVFCFSSKPFVFVCKTHFTSWAFIAIEKLQHRNLVLTPHLPPSHLVSIWEKVSSNKKQGRGCF